MNTLTVSTIRHFEQKKNSSIEYIRLESRIAYEDAVNAFHRQQKGEISSVTVRLFLRKACITHRREILAIPNGKEMMSYMPEVFHPFSAATSM